MRLLQNFLNFNNSKVKYTLLVLGFSLGVLIYLPGLSGGFAHDDYPNIINNSTVHINNLDSEPLISASFSSKSGVLRRPVSMLSFALNHYFTKLDPFYFKAVNILIHLLTALSIFLFSRLLIDCFRRLSNTNISSTQVFYIALITSISWLVSPINLTGVLYIVQRMTSLSALFSVLGLYFYVLARQSMIFKEYLNIPLFLASGTFLVISIFSKENGVLNLFYLICIEFFVLQFSSNTFITKTNFKILFLTIVLLPISVAALYLAYDPTFITKGYEHRSFSLGERVLTQFRALTFYLKMIVMPNNLELGLFHDDFEISKSLLQPISTIFSIVTILVLVICSLIYRKKYPLFAFGIVFFFASHILESTIISLEIMYEHRNYLGSFGIILAVVCTACISINKQSTRKLAVFVCCAWLSVISFTTMSRASQWGNSITHAYNETLHHPQSSRAHFYLGRTYANLVAMDLIEETEGAFQSLERAMQLSPTEISAEAVAIRLAGAIDIPAKEEWVSNIKSKIKLNPITHNVIGALSELNKCLEIKCSISIDEVFQIYQITLNHKLPCSNAYKSDILTQYAAFALNHLRAPTVAYNASRDAVLLSPDLPQYRVNFISILNALGRSKEAQVQLDYVENLDKYRIYSKVIEEQKIYTKAIEEQRNNHNNNIEIGT